MKNFLAWFLNNIKTLDVFIIILLITCWIIKIRKDKANAIIKI